MKYAIHRISLDINDDSPSQLTLSARQGDTAKLLIITLLADKHNYIIAEGCYASFIGKKADGASFEHECVIDRKTNKIEYAFQPLTVSTSGRIDCEINLYSEFGERLTTSRFNIQVYETIFTGEVNDAEDDITAVTQLRADLNALIANIEQKLENGEFVGEKGEKGESVTIDKTLTIEKAAADAKAVGDKFKEVEEKLEGVEDIVVDSELSSESENPVQNKVINDALKGKVDSITSSGYRVYVHTPNGDGATVYGQDPTPTTIPIRNTNGNFQVTAPKHKLDCSNKEYVDEKFNGANKALTFNTYGIMVDHFNSIDDYTTYKVGQNIYIGTINVPDLWVGEIIVNEKVTYTYTNDDAIMSTLKEYGWIAIGHFVLYPLETQKVDLTNYVKNTDYASVDGTTAGLLAVNKNKGIARANLLPTLEIVPAEKTHIDGKTKYLYLPITPARLDYAVKVGITTNTETLTADEKAKAQAWLGVQNKRIHKVTITSTVTLTQEVETTTMLILSAKEEALTVEEILTEEKDNIIDITKDGVKQSISQFIYQPEGMGIVFEFVNGGDFYDYYFSSVEEAEQAVTDVVLY